MLANLTTRIAIEESSLGGTYRVVEFTLQGFLVLVEYGDLEMAQDALSRFAAEVQSDALRN
jgi:hypothetical protein